MVKTKEREIVVREEAVAEGDEGSADRRRSKERMMGKKNNKENQNKL